MVHAYNIHACFDKAISESNFLMLQQGACCDFPDFPREIFYYIIQDSDENSKLSEKDLQNFKEKIYAINQRTDVCFLKIFYYFYEKIKLLQLMNPKELMQTISISPYKGIVLVFFIFLINFFNKFCVSHFYLIFFLSHLNLSINEGINRNI